MELQDWLTAVTAELGLEDSAVDDVTRATLLALAADAAHGVERVAAPLTTYLAGVAVGRGAELPATATAIAALLDDAPELSGD